MEECVLIDQKALNEIVIPTTNVNRLLPDGTRHKEETVNKSQIYITTAGYKNTFAYSKLIELLIQSIIDPDEVMILGGTYQTPVTEGLLDEDFVDQLKMSGTFNEDSFEREYCSVWTGDIENAFFSAEKFDKHRILALPELEASNKKSKDTYYVLGVDVGRIGCTSEVCVFKVAPNGLAGSMKSLVNLFTFDAEHFEDQAIHLKKLFYRYKAQAISIDANGLGVGLVDYMVKSQIDPDSGEVLPPFGVANDTEKLYKKFETSDMEPDALFLIKANAPINTEAYSYAQTQMQGGKIKFLVDEASAKERLMSTKKGQEMSLNDRNEYLKPYVQTTMLREQLLNLVEQNEGVNIILKQSSRKIKKDKVSAFVYGLYYIKNDDERRKKRKHFRASEMMFFS